MKRRLLCPAPEDTLAVGEVVGRAAVPGLVVALQGPLGAGKTLFTKGLARGLGVAQWRYVTSPTFAIHNVYRGRLRLHHLDLYRLADAAELDHLGLEEALHGSDVCVLEWPDLLLGDLPEERLLVRFEWSDTGDRVLEVEADGPYGDTLSAALDVAVRDSGVREE